MIVKKKRISPMLGRHHSNEARAKMSAAHRRNRSRLGQKHSEESRRKMSERASGANNSQWKGGRYLDSLGYVKVWSPHHPNKDYNSRVLEHRLVMEDFLGRYLEKYEQVHHKNGNRQDNRIENLDIVMVRSHFGQVRCPYCLKSYLIK